MKSLYIDPSLYENHGHYEIAKMLEDYPLDETADELYIKCNSEEEYNAILNKLHHMMDDIFKMYGTTRDPLELVIQEDPRDKYRKFDEKFLLEEGK